MRYSPLDEIAHQRVEKQFSWRAAGNRFVRIVRIQHCRKSAATTDARVNRDDAAVDRKRMQLERDVFLRFREIV